MRYKRKDYGTAGHPQTCPKYHPLQAPAPREEGSREGAKSPHKLAARGQHADVRGGHHQYLLQVDVEKGALRPLGGHTQHDDQPHHCYQEHWQCGRGGAAGALGAVFLLRRHGYRSGAEERYDTDQQRDRRHEERQRKRSRICNWEQSR